jgi:hypothetical protein
MESESIIDVTVTFCKLRMAPDQLEFALVSAVAAPSTHRDATIARHEVTLSTI